MRLNIFYFLVVKTVRLNDSFKLIQNHLIICKSLFFFFGIFFQEGPGFILIHRLKRKGALGWVYF